MIERAGCSACPHFLVSEYPVQVFAQPVPAGRAKAGCSVRPEIGTAAYGCRADCARCDGELSLFPSSGCCNKHLSYIQTGPAVILVFGRTKMLDPFADAQAWYDRAQKHIAEYRGLAYGEHDQIWKLLSNRREDGSFAYSLRFDRSLLARLKPVACEVANALFQSLDNIIAVGARRAKVLRGPQISWPWAIESDPDSSLEGAVRPAIGGKLDELSKKGFPKPWLALIEETFAASAVGLSHIDVVKEVSLSGKHWELVSTGANAFAISWTVQGSNEQIIAEIPADHFETSNEFVFHEGGAIVAPRFQMMTGTRLVAAAKEFQPEPISAFEYTARFVSTALEKARQL